MRFGPCTTASVERTPDAQERSRLGGVAGERPGLRICCLGVGLLSKPGLHRLQQVTQRLRTLFRSSHPLRIETGYFSSRPGTIQVLETTCHVPIGGCLRHAEAVQSLSKSEGSQERHPVLSPTLC